MAYTPDVGGGGGGTYTARTHRELNAYIGSVSYLDLSEIRNTWRNTGSQAFQMAELIETKLEQLVAQNGWTGPGAEAFARVIRHDLIAPLRAYALRTAGFSREGEQRVGHAADMDQLIETISGSFSTASGNNIPWDVDSDWQIRRKEVDQSLFGKVDEFVTGKDEDYEKAKSNAPYEIVNGRGQVVREVPKEVFEPIEESVPGNPSSPVYPQTDTVVANDVDRFDRIMQRLAIGTSPRSSVESAAEDVDGALRRFAPSEVEQSDMTTSRETSGPGGGGGGGGSTPQAPGSTPERPGTPSVPRDPDAGGRPEVPTPGLPTPGLPGEHPTGENPITGIGGPDTTPGVPAGPIGSLPGSVPGGDGLPGGSFGGHDAGATPLAAPELAGSGGTSAAGINPAATAGVGGIGAGVTPAAGALAVNVGASAGVGGMGNLAPVAMNPGRPGTSFSLGADGRPRINTGSVGALGTPGGPGTGASGVDGGRGTGGAGGPGSTGAGAGGAAPLPGGRRQDRQEGDEDADLDETWLEEDRSVWGGRTGAPPSEIR